MRVLRVERRTLFLWGIATPTEASALLLGVLALVLLSAINRQRKFLRGKTHGLSWEVPEGDRFPQALELAGRLRYHVEVDGNGD